MRDQAIKELIKDVLKKKDIYNKKNYNELCIFYTNELEKNKNDGMNFVIAEEEAKKALKLEFKNYKSKNRYVFPCFMSLIMFVLTIGEFIGFSVLKIDFKVMTYYLFGLLGVAALLFIIGLIFTKGKNKGTYLADFVIMLSIGVTIGQIYIYLATNKIKIGDVTSASYLMPYAIKINNWYIIVSEVIITCLFVIYYFVKLIKQNNKQKKL